MVRQTSIMTYINSDDNLKPVPYGKIIYNAIRLYGPCSDREIENHTGLTINIVTGRRNELVRNKKVRKHGTGACRVTGSPNVCLWVVQ